MPLRSIAVLCVACLSYGVSPAAAADPQCTQTAAVTPGFGSVTSFTAQSTAQPTSASSVASCAGALLNVLVLLGDPPYLRATVGSAHSYRLVNTNGSGDALAYSIYAAPNGQYPFVPGVPFNYYQQTLLNLLGLLGGSGGSLPMYFVTTPGGNLSAGTYTDTFTVDWNWKICNVGIAVCLGYTTGNGATTVTLSLTVTNACQIASAPNISFGSAPAAGSFAPVTQNVGVLCTKGFASYTVGFDGGQHAAGGRRQMINGSDVLQYDLFKPSTNDVWGLTGSDAVVNTVSANGTTAQTFAYRAQVYANQPTPPVGHYADSVVLNVSW
jgi:spore coat protein U-like protein